MANETTLIFEIALPIPYTCADNTGIEKGAILKLSDPMTASLASGAGSIVAGIAAEEKIANDGKTKIAVYTKGIFKGLAGGAITVGDALISDTTGATNEILTAGVNAENILGRALETAADTDTFLFELNPFTANLA
jgi:hypothetical protein